MKIRPAGFGLLLATTLFMSGCCWWRPWGCCGPRRCCYAAPETDVGLVAANKPDAQPTISVPEQSRIMASQ